MSTQRRNEALMDSAETVTDDLTGKEMYALTRTSAGKVRLAQSGEAVCGICQEGKVVGKHSSYAFGGVLNVVASAAITPGQAVMAGEDGSCVPGSTNSFGVCRNSVLSGEIAEIYFDQRGSS